MEDSFRNLYCDCDEYLGEINIITSMVTLDKAVKFTIEDSELNRPTIVCKCPHCGQVNYLRGKIN